MGKLYRTSDIIGHASSLLYLCRVAVVFTTYMHQVYDCRAMNILSWVLETASCLMYHTNYDNTSVCGRHFTVSWTQGTYSSFLLLNSFFAVIICIWYHVLFSIEKWTPDWHASGATRDCSETVTCTSHDWAKNWLHQIHVLLSFWIDHYYSVSEYIISSEHVGAQHTTLRMFARVFSANHIFIIFCHNIGWSSIR